MGYIGALVYLLSSFCLNQSELDMFTYSPRLFRPPAHASYACQADLQICSSRESGRGCAPIPLELDQRLPRAATGMENGILRGSPRAAHHSGPFCANVGDDKFVGG